MHVLLENLPQIDAYNKINYTSDGDQAKETVEAPVFSDDLDEVCLMIHS